MHQADAVAAALDLDLGGVCHACLSFVISALDDGNRAEVAREVRRVTPTLWVEGLDVQILAGVKSAAATGVEGAEAALADLERKGFRSAIARAVVLRLARDLSRRTRLELAAYRVARDRLSLAAPAEEALAEFGKAKEAWLLAAREAGRSIPEPRHRPAIYVR